MNTFLFLAVIVLMVAVLILAIVVGVQKKKLNERSGYELVELTDEVPKRGNNVPDDRFKYCCALKFADNLAKSGAITACGSTLHLKVLRKIT